MSGQADPELHIYCEDNFASLLIEQTLPSDFRTRTHIVPVGSKSEMAKQASFHFRAGFGQHMLLIWDGEVPREEVCHYLNQAIGSFKEDASSKESFKQRLHWGFLPGQDLPERWGLSILDCPEGYELLGNELSAPATVAREHIERLRSLPGKDHRQLGYELGRRTNTSAGDSLRMLAKSISHISSNPLKCVQEMVKAVLDGKGVRGG